MASVSLLISGPGSPTSPNVHEIAQRINPGTRVVYVDNDPIVLAHDRALLTDNDHVNIIDGDLRSPDSVLNHRDMRHLVDFAQPVAVLFVAVLHCVTDEEDPWRAVSSILDIVAPGSYVAISHGISDYQDPADISRLEQLYESATTPAVFRTYDQVESMFAKLGIVPPGLVDVTEWRPESGTSPHGAGWYVGGIGYKS